MTTTAALTASQQTAWRTFLRAHSVVLRRLEGDLVGAHDLPMPSYDVLVQLSEAPGRALRMTELAERVLLSRSGLTRLVDRLVRDGLVERQACPEDARGTLAVLTTAGLERLRGAWPTHLRGVASYLDRLDPSEVETFTTLLTKMVPQASMTTTACGADEADVADVAC